MLVVRKARTGDAAEAIEVVRVPSWNCVTTTTSATR